MRELTCDVAVIGAGTAGLAAYDAAAKAGARAVLIERGPGGTTCARVGCMPSKLLIEAASAAYDARHAGVFGVEVGEVRIDGAAVMRRVRALRDDFVASVLDGLDRIPDEQRVCGTARFADPATLLVDDHTRIVPGAVVIATGSSPSLPPSLHPVADRVLTTDTLFEIETLPDSLAVLGAGAVGLELAQAMTRLGVRVTLLDPADAVGGIRDPEVGARAAALLSAEIDLRLGATVETAEAQGDGVRLTWRLASGERGEGTFARVLAAAGRPPNLSDLDLAAAGLDDPRRTACRTSTRAPCNAAPCRSSSRATPTTSGRCCTRPSARAGSPAATPRAFPRSRRRRPGRPSASSSPIRRSPPSAAPSIPRRRATG